MKCANCQLTCHEKCRDKVQLNCTAFERPEDQQHSSTSGSGNNSSSNSNSSSEKDLSTLANISPIVDEEIISEGELLAYQKMLLTYKRKKKSLGTIHE